MEMPNRKKEDLSKIIDDIVGYDISDKYSKKHAEFINKKTHSIEDTFQLEKELRELKDVIDKAVAIADFGKVEKQSLMDYLEF